MDFKEYHNLEIPEMIRTDFRLPNSDEYYAYWYEPAGVILIKKNRIEDTNEFGPQSYSAFKGELQWRVKGKLHRYAGPALINYPKGLLQWYAGGKLLKEEKVSREEAKNLIDQFIGTYNRQKEQEVNQTNDTTNNA